MENRPRIRPLAGSFDVHRLAPDAAMPEGLLAQDLVWIARTPDELSVVCRAGLELDPNAPVRRDWGALEVEGPLDFSLVGLLAEIAGVLAEGGISILALSTFDTDYVLVPRSRLPEALRCLEALGFPLGPARR